MKKLLILLSLFIMTGCQQKPAYQVEVYNRSDDTVKNVSISDTDNNVLLAVDELEKFCYKYSSVNKAPEKLYDTVILKWTDIKNKKFSRTVKIKKENQNSTGLVLMIMEANRISQMTVAYTKQQLKR